MTPKREPDGLEEQANGNITKFNKDKCKVLPLRRKSPLQQYRLGAARLGSSSAPQGSGWSWWAVS